MAHIEAVEKRALEVIEKRVDRVVVGKVDTRMQRLTGPLYRRGDLDGRLAAQRVPPSRKREA